MKSYIVVICFTLALFMSCGTTQEYNLSCEPGYKLVGQTCVPVAKGIANCGTEINFTFKIVDALTRLAVNVTEFNIVTDQGILEVGSRTINDPVGYYRFNDLVTCTTIQIGVTAPCYKSLELGEDSYFSVPATGNVFELPIIPLPSCTDNELQIAFYDCMNSTTNTNSLQYCCEAFPQDIFDAVCQGTYGRKYE